MRISTHGRRHITVIVCILPLMLSWGVGSELRQHPHGGDVELSFRVQAGPARLPAVLGDLAATGVEVRAATLRQPTLDDVFLSLTGRSLREGADAR